MGYKNRDVEVVSLNDTQYLVVACDSCGAIGEKELDLVKVPWWLTGKTTARVALMEILAVGAAPQMLSVAISNEPTPAGEELLRGVREELELVGLGSLPLAISTEKNMPSRQTGLGITAIGICEKERLRVGRSQPGHSLFCLGLPKVGNEASDPNDPEIIQCIHLLKLMAIPGVYDVIPVGSKGIRGEAEILAHSIGTRLIIDAPANLDLDKSGGPSTCVIFTAKEDIKLKSLGQLPLHKIGKLE